MRNQSIVSEYGQYPFDVFKRHPDILSRIQTIRPGFDPANVDVATPSLVARLSDGREFFLMRGCRPHACPDYRAVMGLDITSGEWSIYEESVESGKAFFGSRDANVQALLQYVGNDEGKIDSLIGTQGSVPQ